MGGLFGKIHNRNCCCPDGENCFPCPEGPYPEFVDVWIPSLGLGGVAGNQFFGEPGNIYQYLWEGTFGGDAGDYDVQCTFEICGFGVAIQFGGDGVCTQSRPPISGGTITALSCPPDPFSVLYRVNCAEGGTLDIYLTEI